VRVRLYGVSTRPVRGLYGTGARPEPANFRWPKCSGEISLAVAQKGVTLSEIWRLCFQRVRARAGASCDIWRPAGEFSPGGEIAGENSLGEKRGSQGGESGGYAQIIAQNIPGIIPRVTQCRKVVTRHGIQCERFQALSRCVHAKV
jgi:hypothetical protein